MSLVWRLENRATFGNFLKEMYLILQFQTLEYLLSYIGQCTKIFWSISDNYILCLRRITMRSSQINACCWRSRFRLSGSPETKNTVIFLIYMNVARVWTRTKIKNHKIQKWQPLNKSFHFAAKMWSVFSAAKFEFYI